MYNSVYKQVWLNVSWCYGMLLMATLQFQIVSFIAFPVDIQLIIELFKHDVPLSAYDFIHQTW